MLVTVVSNMFPFMLKPVWSPFNTIGGFVVQFAKLLLFMTKSIEFSKDNTEPAVNTFPTKTHCKPSTFTLISEFSNTHPVIVFRLK